MSDEPFYTPGKKPPPPRQPRPAGEPLWECRHNHVTWSAELHDQAPYGWDCHLLRDTEFFASRRFDFKEAAIGWGDAQRLEIERLAVMDMRPVLTIPNDPVERIALKVQQLAAVKPALVRLLEWQIDQELEQTVVDDDSRELGGGKAGF
jgi:hypothetical protein